jgi:hypothetical protein
MVNFSHWKDIEDYLSTASNQIKGDLFEKLTDVNTAEHRRLN